MEEEGERGGERERVGGERKKERGRVIEREREREGERLERGMRLLLVKDDHSHSDDEYSPHLKIAAAAKRGVSSYITSLLTSRYKSDRPYHMPYSSCLALFAFT